MKLNKLFLTAIAGAMFLTSCSSDDDSGNDISIPQGEYDNGVFILNEGGFGQGNASVSFLSNAMELENNIFATVNQNAILGDTGQDIGLHGDLAYIILNYSNKIEIVNRYTFEKVATISSQLLNPRYIAFAGNKAFVTNWGDAENTEDDYIAVIDVTSNQVTSTIPVAEGPERIIEEDGKLYVAHKGGYGYGNTITVINGAANTVEAIIEVGDVPGSIDIEDGKLYVMNEGMPSWAGTETSGSLQVISLNNNTVSATYDFPEATHPSNLTIEDDNIYYTVDSAIYVMPLSSSTLPSSPLFTTAEQGAYGIYSFEVEDNRIYIGDALDYNSNGKVYIYSTNGALQETFTVGIIPTGFYFND